MDEPGVPRHAALEHLLDVIAVTPELDGVLVYDATVAQLTRIAELFELRLAAIGPPVERVVLGASHGEDELWGTGHGLPEAWRRRGLLRAPGDAQLLVIVPDLAQLSVPAARAAVMLLGGGPLHIERSGESAAVASRGRVRWLAGLAEDDVGQVSPHLVDRFAVQVRLEDRAVDDVARRTAAVAAALTERSGHPPQLHPVTTATLHAAVRRPVTLGPGAVNETLARSPARSQGVRRPIALLRIAGGIARLAGDEVIAPAHVQAAATLIGRPPDEHRAGAGSPSDLSNSTGSSGAPSQTDLPRVGTDGGMAASAGEAKDSALTELIGKPVVPGDVVDSAEQVLESVELGPAPEPDAAAIQRDHASLRLPWRRSGGRARGTVIGARPAVALEDIAAAATLFAAAPFQPMRRRDTGAPAGSAVILRRSDLRTYRRAPIADELLMLVIDYTSVVERDWQQAMLPYLARAYTARAQIALISVGALQDGAKETWRADLTMARSILVPAVAAALDRSAGKATPLAHGLELAHRTTAQALAHGRNAVRRVTLVVVTDGRGNVPLAISRGEAWSGPVGRRGIEDACRCARAIGALPHVRRVLIDPQPTSLPDLPRSLAAALGAELVVLEPGASR